MYGKMGRSLRPIFQAAAVPGEPSPHLKFEPAAFIVKLAARAPRPPTINSTTFDDDDLVLAGLKAGARGVLLKDVSLEQPVDAIHTAAEGGSPVRPAVTQRSLSGMQSRRNDLVSLGQPDPLPERETKILRRMPGDDSNEEIAESLGVAEGTGKNHVSNILSRLGARDRTRAMPKAFKLKLI